VTVASLDGSSAAFNKTKWQAAVRITISPALAEAVVSGAWSNGTATTCTTDASGQCSVTLLVSNTTGSVTFTVSNVTLAGYQYVPGVTSITVNKP